MLVLVCTDMVGILRCEGAGMWGAQAGWWCGALAAAALLLLLLAARCRPRRKHAKRLAAPHQVSTVAWLNLSV